MADARITSLTALTTPADGDVLPIVDVSDTTDGASGTTKKIAMSSIFPSSSTDNAIARFDGTTGKLIQNSGARITDAGNLDLDAPSTITYTAAADDSATALLRLNAGASQVGGYGILYSQFLLNPSATPGNRYAEWRVGDDGDYQQAMIRSDKLRIIHKVNTGGAIIDASGVNTSNKTFTFPNATGVLGVVVTKTDTGDPTGIEGLFEINTFDNKFKVYADGAWRQLATW